MGRFASTVALYEELRPPYPEEFFRTVALRLKLSKQHALIDLGTGPGLLALGFAPHVGRIVGVDPEPDMLAAAKQAAARACRDFALIEARAETLAETMGMFDLVTIGRALHWMDRGATLSTLERLVAPDGRILVCASFSAHDARNPWLEDYNAVRRAWSPAALWEESGSGARTHRRAHQSRDQPHRQRARSGAARADLLIVLTRGARRQCRCYAARCRRSAWRP
jgi:SAM-dependent methyltransferase